MTEREALQLLFAAGAVITDSHFVCTSGMHDSVYVNKDAVYPHTVEISDLCRALARRYEDRIEIVAAPAVGGVILSQWVAFHLTSMTRKEVLGVYAEKEGDRFVFRRGYDKLFPGRTVLVAEDVLTTGGSAKKVVEAVREAGGEVVGLGVLCNRGGVTAEDVGNVPRINALVNIALDAWDEVECPLCAGGIPINTEVGKGREYLQKNSDKLCVCPNPECGGLADWVDRERGIFSCRRCGATTAAMEFE